MIAATPGEGVLNKQVMQAIGPQRFHALNNGEGLGMGDITIVPGTVQVMIGARQVAEATVHYQLKMAARK
jgi:hypothetical protein